MVPYMLDADGWKLMHPSLDQQARVPDEQLNPFRGGKFRLPRL